MREKILTFIEKNSRINLKELAIMLGAVSYTHLDVYKRQQYNNAIATAGMITSIIGFVLSVICTIGMMVLFASGIYDRLVNMTM